MTDADRLRAAGLQAAGPGVPGPQDSAARPAVLEAVRTGEHPIVCRDCGAVAHAGAVAGQAPCLERAAGPEPAAGAGFTIERAEITFWGLCPRCRPAAARLPAPRPAGARLLLPQPEQVIAEYLLHPAVEIHDQP